MKKVFYLLIVVLFANSTLGSWVCYPPYGGGNGPNCFGSNYSCKSWNCACNNDGCCCYGLRQVLPFPKLDYLLVEMDESNVINITNKFSGQTYNFETSKVLAMNCFECTKNPICYDEFLAFENKEESDDKKLLGDLFQLDIITIENQTFAVFNIYSAEIIEKQMKEFGGIKKEEAYLRQVKIYLW